MPEPPVPPPAPDLAAIEARCDRATPEPWFWLREDGYVVDRENAPIFTDLGSNETWIISSGLQQRGKVTSGCLVVREADKDFIQYARQDVPALVAYARALDAENARLRAGLAAIEGEYAGVALDTKPLITQPVDAAVLRAAFALLGDEIAEDTPETLARRIAWARKSIGW